MKERKEKSVVRSETEIHTKAGRHTFCSTLSTVEATTHAHMVVPLRSSSKTDKL